MLDLFSTRLIIIVDVLKGVCRCLGIKLYQRRTFWPVLETGGTEMYLSCTHFVFVLAEPSEQISIQMISDWQVE